jgi:hypothetical protein
MVVDGLSDISEKAIVFFTEKDEEKQVIHYSVFVIERVRSSFFNLVIYQSPGTQGKLNVVQLSTTKAKVETCLLDPCRQCDWQWKTAFIAYIFMIAWDVYKVSSNSNFPLSISDDSRTKYYDIDYLKLLWTWIEWNTYIINYVPCCLIYMFCRKF